MSLKYKLAGTLRAIYGLNARRQDDLEDYFHDAIVTTLTQGKTLDQWLGYVYKIVSNRISRNHEGREYLSIEEGILPEARPDDLDLRLDIGNALKKLTLKQSTYIYEYFFLGLTFEEISEKYITTSPAVSRVIQRGLRAMKRVLTNNGVEG